MFYWCVCPCVRCFFSFTFLYNSFSIFTSPTYKIIPPFEHTNCIIKRIAMLLFFFAILMPISIIIVISSLAFCMKNETIQKQNQKKHKQSYHVAYGFDRLTAHSSFTLIINSYIDLIDFVSSALHHYLENHNFDGKMNEKEKLKFKRKKI